MKRENRGKEENNRPNLETLYFDLKKNLRKIRIKKKNAGKGDKKFNNDFEKEKRKEDSRETIQEKDLPLGVWEALEVGDDFILQPTLHCRSGHPASDLVAGEEASRWSILDPFLANGHRLEDEKWRKKGPVGGSSEHHRHRPLGAELRDLGCGFSSDENLKKQRNNEIQF